MSQFPKVPGLHSNANEWLIKLANAVNRIIDGKTNNTGDVTLTASSATTTVTDRRVGVDSVISFMPTTVNAATEFGAGTMYVSTKTAGTSFVITHVNNVQTDRTFRYTIIG